MSPHPAGVRRVRSLSRVLLTTSLPIAAGLGFGVAMLAPLAWPAAFTLFSPLYCDGAVEMARTPYALPGERGETVDFVCVAADGARETLGPSIMFVTIAGYTALFLAMLTVLALFTRWKTGAVTGRPLPTPGGRRDGNTDRETGR